MDLHILKSSSDLLLHSIHLLLLLFYQPIYMIQLIKWFCIVLRAYNIIISIATVNSSINFLLFREQMISNHSLNNNNNNNNKWFEQLFSAFRSFQEQKNRKIMLKLCACDCKTSGINMSFWFVNMILAYCHSPKSQLVDIFNKRE